MYTKANELEAGDEIAIGGTVLKLERVERRETAVRVSWFMCGVPGMPRYLSSGEFKPNDQVWRCSKRAA